MRSWTLPEFSTGRRKSLFADAVRQYRRREFRAVILSIAPQVEGLLKDFLLAEGLATPAEVDRMSTVQLFTTYVRSEREPSIGGYATQLELLFSHFVWVAPAPGNRVRRHPQAHGREVPRKSEQEALRTWLMLETLHFHLVRVRRARAAAGAA